MVDLGFEVQENMAKKPDEYFSSSLQEELGGVEGRTHNGAVRPDILKRLQALALRLYREGLAISMNHANGMAFGSFWYQWHRLHGEDVRWWPTKVSQL